MTGTIEECADGNEDGEVRWAGDEGERPEYDTHHAFIAEADCTVTEEALENSSFLHGASFEPSAMMKEMRRTLSRQNDRRFQCVKFDTGCNPDQSS